MIISDGEPVVNPDRPLSSLAVHCRLTTRAQTAPMSKVLLIIVLIAVIAISAWLVTRPAVPKPYAAEYRNALERFSGSTEAVDRGLERFEAVYSDLTRPDIEERIADVYAPRIYFNDTLKTFEDGAALARYMGRTGRSLDHSEVRIDGVIRDAEDVFVRWTMHFSTRAMGRPVESESIGMTHLRFDQSGHIVLHQDFWDPAAGLYRNLPVIGYGLSVVDRQLSSAGSR